MMETMPARAKNVKSKPDSLADARAEALLQWITTRIVQPVRLDQYAYASFLVTLHLRKGEANRVLSQLAGRGQIRLRGASTGVFVETITEEVPT